MTKKKLEMSNIPRKSELSKIPAELFVAVQREIGRTFVNWEEKARQAGVKKGQFYRWIIAQRRKLSKIGKKGGH